MARGTKFTRDMLCFGEENHYKIPAGHLVRGLEGKMAPRWKTGVFLGYSRDSHEYAVWDPVAREVKMARTLKRVPQNLRFDLEHL